jgi:hypothetical protein
MRVPASLKRKDSLLTDGLIHEIQREAVISGSSVSSLLRKIKLAAAKLKLPKIEEWVEHELTGYRDQTTEGVFHLAFSPTKLEIFNQMFGCNTPRAGVDIPTGVVAHAIETVRNLVLDWSIAMEKAGVSGEGISFSNDEREKAQSASAIFHIGSIGTVTGNLGVANVSGDITSAPLNIEQVENLISQVKSHAQGLTNEGVNSADLSAAISSLEKAIEAKKPDLIRTGLNELQKVVAKAAGGLLAHGVLGLMHKILATGIPNV